MNRAERFSSRYKPYLWAVGDGIDTLPLDELVGQRYRVVAPCIWLDTQPEQRPDTPDLLPEVAQPYLKTHALRLHLPGLYGVLERAMFTPVLLLENAPIHPQTGDLFPDLETALYHAQPLRQAQWLWQLWELWHRLEPHGLRRNLLRPGNVRVEGWRLRLLELHPDPTPATLADLAELWRPWLSPLHLSVSEPLRALVNAIDANGVDEAAVGLRLNELLLQQAALNPSRIALAGATTIGPTAPRNEDACWPDGITLDASSDEGLRVGIVCDGVGGHDGGEIASQLAIQSLKLQLQTLLAETDKESQILPPDIVIQQIEAILRIVNELISFQNDNQGRVGRQRMGTTLVMAVLVPQRVQTDEGWRRVNEVYLAHVGDSRAYWITPDYCHQLTVDDDIAGREVTAGRQTLAVALERSDAGALTQALGTRSGDHFQPHIQRLVLDETGLLLLCSDGLSDRYRIEEAWANYIGLIIKDIVTLESAVASWLELANQKNGHDNTAVVLLQHKLLTPAEPAPAAEADRPQDRVPASGATLYGEGVEDERAVATPTPPKPIPAWVLALSGAILLGLVAVWWFTRPTPPPADPQLPPSEFPVEGSPSAEPEPTAEPGE